MKTYDPVIYPTNLVIASSVDELNKAYKNDVGGNLTKTENSAATTYKMFGRKDGFAATGIVLHHKPTIKTIAHESFHAAQDMLTYIQQDFVYDGTNESWAYLIGWIALCIEDFINKEFKEDKNEKLL